MAVEPHTVHSVDKAMELLELLLRSRWPMTLQELSNAAGYPKSTTHALLATLRRHEMVRQNDDGRYALGIRLFECGCAVAEQWDVSRLARPYLERLAAQTGASAFISVLEGDHAISLDQCAGGGGGLHVIPEVGSRLPLHATAQGKVFLSRLSESDALQRLQRAGMTAYTPHTVTDTGRLLHVLEQVRRDGYAVENGEYKIGLRAAAAPVPDRSGTNRYALGVVGLFRRVESEEFQYAVEQTVLLARQLSQALGAAV
ncbi:MAG: IclR family transcriptional regulator [Oscillospiraceae bacterium]|nr:IclR family transcriptional regulator [Oscillospiraceae bacterium]